MVATMQVKASEHPIKSVTIFKSCKAEIVRTFSLTLKAGQNQIEISGLPSCIDTESARVSGMGDARLFDVVCSLKYKSSSVELADSEQEGIRILRVQKDEILAERSAVQAQADVFSEYAKSVKAEHVSPQDMSAFMQSFGSQNQDSLKALSALKEKILDIERQIDKEVERLAMKKGKTDGKVSAVVVAQRDGPVKLELTYIVTNAQWDPTYDLHATTENGKTSTSVSLHYRARIIQTTGEDWKDTALILSTTSTEAMMDGIPPLQSYNLSVVNAFTSNKGGSWYRSNAIQPQQFQQQQVQQQPAFGFGQVQQSEVFGAPSGSRRHQQQHYGATQQQTSGSLFGQATGYLAPGGVFGAAQQPTEVQAISAADLDVAPLSDEDGWDSGDEHSPDQLMQHVTEGLAVVNKSPLSISYAVEGVSSIPSDGEVHKVSVAVLPFEANVTCVAMPRQNAVAYMQSEVKNTSDFRLLPGTVAVFLDNSYVSRTSISDINSGDTFECTFGVDTSMKISYTRKSTFTRDPTSTFSEQFKTTKLTSTTKILNQHSFPISIVSKDSVPLCDDKRVKVILRKPEGLVNAKEKTVDLARADGIKVKWGKLVGEKGGEKEGKFEWVGSIAAGKEVVLVTEWEVKCPADVTWIDAALKFGGKV